MLRSLILAVPVALATVLVLPPAHAQTTAPTPPVGQPGDPAPLTERAPEVVTMLEALRLYDILGVMSSEGVEAAMNLEADMFPGEGGDAWAAQAHRIHGVDRMTELFEEAFPVGTLGAEHTAAITAFFTAEPGRSIAEAELAARSAFLETDVEEAAKEAFRAAVAGNDPRIDLLTDFIETNDLVERNVSGALNSNFAFYRGLSDGDAFEVEIPEDLMLQEVWGQEADVRRDTIEWLYAFQLSAYAGLSDADLEAYTAFSATPAGQALNAALFAAFDALFDRLSYDLGRAAAGFIAGEDA